MGRFAAVFAIVAAPIFAATLPALSDRLLGRPSLVRSDERVPGIRRCADRRGPFLTGIEPLAAWLNRNGPETAGYPCAAADYVARQVKPNSHRLINEFDWGGYLEWRLGEKYQAFVDGRTQVFTPDFWQATYLGDDGGAKEISPRNRGRRRRAARFAKAVPRRLAELGWKSVYRDDRAEVLLPPAAPAAKKPTGPRLRSCSETE